MLKLWFQVKDVVFAVSLVLTSLLDSLKLTGEKGRALASSAVWFLGCNGCFLTRPLIRTRDCFYKLLDWRAVQMNQVRKSWARWRVRESAAAHLSAWSGGEEQMSRKRSKEEEQRTFLWFCSVWFSHLWVKCYCSQWGLRSESRIVLLSSWSDCLCHQKCQVPTLPIYLFSGGFCLF